MGGKGFMDANGPQFRRMKDIHDEHRIWSDKTFGNVGPVGPLKHLAKEALEAAAASGDPVEYADCLFLFWDAFARQDAFDIGDLLDAMQNKLIKNRLREWPAPKDGEPREHVK